MLRLAAETWMVVMPLSRLERNWMKPHCEVTRPP
jgi:hypothetical protein